MTLRTPVCTELNTGGTTEEMMQPLMSPGLVSNRDRTFLISTPYWSEVLMWSVAMRSSKAILSSRMPPMTMLVFPMSMARSIVCFTSGKNLLTKTSLLSVFPVPCRGRGKDQVTRLFQVSAALRPMGMRATTWMSTLPMAVTSTRAATASAMLEPVMTAITRPNTASMPTPMALAYSGRSRK